MNFILNTDSYKASHFLQYPPGTEKVYSYIESRQGGEYNQVVFFGLQGFLNQIKGKVVTQTDIEEAEAFFNLHGEPFNRLGWQHIVDKWNGRLPLKISAVSEGNVIPSGNVLVTVENTDENVPWLTSYIETALLRAVWYPTTVATVSWSIKQVIKDFLNDTCDDPDNVLPFRLHDFGARGVSSMESAGIGGAAHLVNFLGTDTISGILYASKNYFAQDMSGFSIPAAEHSTITAWGKNREKDAYLNMVHRFGGYGKLYAVVSDSYDLDNAVRNIWTKDLKDIVKITGGTVVIRPDSGNPVDTPVRVVRELKEILWNECTINSKGYVVLPNWVRVIQGDGVNKDSIFCILHELKKIGISAENIAFGMGGALLQSVNRDTARFAMKTSAVQIDGLWKDVQKNPKTDRSKASKAGRLALIREDGAWQTERFEGNVWRNELKEVFKNGVLYNLTTFADVRKRANSYLE